MCVSVSVRLCASVCVCVRASFGCAAGWCMDVDDLVQLFNFKEEIFSLRFHSFYSSAVFFFMYIFFDTYIFKLEISTAAYCILGQSCFRSICALMVQTKDGNTVLSVPYAKRKGETGQSAKSFFIQRTVSCPYQN